MPHKRPKSTQERFSQRINGAMRVALHKTHRGLYNRFQLSELLSADLKRNDSVELPEGAQTQYGKPKKKPQPFGCSLFLRILNVQKVTVSHHLKHVSNPVWKLKLSTDLGVWLSVFNENTPIGGVMSKTCTYPKAVHVCSYMRRRNGRFERVCEHCRSYPK